jgi:hypothetical protein
MEATMIRYDALTLMGLLIATSIACEKPGATERQREEQANHQVAQAKQEANQQTQAAQQTADKDIAAARADFEKTREDYRHARAVDLSDLDKKLSELEAKEKTAKDKARTELQAELAAIREKREAFLKDMYALNGASAATWDEQRAKTGRDWDALRSAVDKAQ